MRMNVYEAVASRQAIRKFASTPVPRAVLDRVFTAAARAPSGGNLQPWTIFVLTGASFARLKRGIAERIAACDPGDAAEFAMDPPSLKSPYRERRALTAEKRYAAMGIVRDDMQARAEAVRANWEGFGAPAALFCYIDRSMGPPQWADVGMYLQTVMLLLREEGLHSCAQMAWTVYRSSVAEVVSPPADLMLYCGMSFGFKDVTATHFRSDRAPLAETVTFLD